MIRKDTSLGKHKNVTELEFGSGDIILSDGESEGREVVFFGQDRPKPEKDWDETVHEAGTSTDDYEDVSVIMTFDNPKSIDAVIRHLNNAKDKLLEN